MEKDYDAYRALVAQTATTATTTANNDLMHERKPIDFAAENNKGDEADPADPSTWSLI